jgi:phenylalanyl-tRNA synthetase beta subunit
VRLFDTFEKEGKKSLAFRLIFQSFERTLTEVEANAAMEKVAATLKAQGFEIR